MSWIRRLPRWFPVVLGAVLLLLAALKLFTPNYLCAGPRLFGRINVIMFLLEIAAGYLLIRAPMLRREVAAVMGAVLIGAAIFLTRVHLRGHDVKGCDCFGPIEVPYAWHLVIIAILASACAIVFLHEEMRLGLGFRMGRRAADPRG